jgi:hypothetical protein
MGLPADVLVRFFARHLDYFIMTQSSHPSGLGTVKTNYRDPKLIVHLPGLAKTTLK